MAGFNKEVKLYGTRGSGFCSMVHVALNLKGVPYDYLEEDLANKSEALLSLNPVHKKVPVLVVDGKPVAESLVILEFIDEAWPEPPLLPEDPYLRSRVRFWANFIYQKLSPLSYKIMQSEAELQEEAVKSTIEELRTLEEGISRDFASLGGPFIHGENLGLLDVVLGMCSTGQRVLGEISGAELLQKERFPMVSSTAEYVENLAVFREHSMPYEELLELVKDIRKKALAVTA